MLKTNRWIATILLLAVLGAGAAAQDAPQTASWAVEIDGRKTWTIRYGFGDALALAGESIGPGDLTLDQTMAVDFTAKALSVFRVVGHFDDQESADAQSLALYVDTDSLHGVAGDFTAPSLGSFYAGSRTMVGAMAEVEWTDGGITVVGAQAAGIRETRQFIGQSSSGERTFAGRRTGDAPASYGTSLDGMGYVELEDLFVEDFTETRLDLGADSLGSTLEQYGVVDLAPALAAYEGRAVKADEIVVVGDEAQALLLRIDPRNLTREAVRDAVRVYNKAAGATIAYPFVVGSDVELAFLTAVSERASLVVGEERHSFLDLRWQRFYNLGQENIEAGTVTVAVRVEADEYVVVGDPDLVGYATTVYAEAGILEAAFPPEFFQGPTASLRVAFSYPVTGGAYMLGASVLPGSETVTMAGRVLVKDLDYTIDYDVGMVALLVEIGPTDPLVVEYERRAGAGAYGRTLYGAVLSIPASDGLALSTYILRGVDSGRDPAERESQKTMPNTQTVVGLKGTISRPDLVADVSLGYAEDVFPFDDNARRAIPNRVSAFGTAHGIVFVGHGAGFAAYADGEWSSYGASAGLSGREVRAIASDADRVYLGTDAGLTIVELEGVAPLDKVANWSRYGKADGLDDPSITAVAVDGPWLWIGTGTGLFRVGVEELRDPDAWLEVDGVARDGVKALCVAPDGLYVGTTSGVARLDRETGEVLSVDASDAATDLATDGESVYAAGPRGLRRLAEGSLAEWIVRDASVATVEAWDGDVFYGTASGLVRTSDGQVEHEDWSVTALGGAAGALWIGTRGDGEGELLVWRRAQSETAFAAKTTGIAPSNPRAYADILPGDHMKTGWTAAATFSHEGDGFTLAGSADRILPGFRALDARGRDDAGGWMLGAEIGLGPDASLSVDTEYRLTDVESPDMRATSDTRLALQGSFGPDVSLVVDYQVEDTVAAERGTERNGLSYDLDVTHRLFDDAMRIAVGWGEGFRWDAGRTPRHETTLTATGAWDVSPDLSTSLTLSRPIRVSRDSLSGSERWAWETEGTLDLGFLGVSGTYALDASRGVPRGSAEISHRATLDVSGDAIVAGDWSFSPSCELAGELDDAIGSASARLSVRSTATGWSARATASVDVSGLGARTQRWSEKLTSSVSYTGIPRLRPSLNYNGSRTVTQVSGHGAKSTWSHAMNGRLTWTSDAGASETLTFSGRVQSSGAASASLANSYSFDVTDVIGGWLRAIGAPGEPQDAVAPAEVDPEAVVASPAEADGADRAITLQTDLGADWRRDAGKDDLSWRAGVTANAALSETWSLSLGLSYRGGVKSLAKPSHGFIAEMTVAIDF